MWNLPALSSSSATCINSEFAHFLTVCDMYCQLIQRRELFLTHPSLRFTPFPPPLSPFSGSMHKGNDKIRAALLSAASHVNSNDEIEMFQLFRYTSASEAICRALNMDLSVSTVGCTRLPVHLEGMNWNDQTQAERTMEDTGEEMEDSPPPVEAEEGGASAAAPTKLTLLDRYFLRPSKYKDLRYAQYYSVISLKPYSGAQNDGDYDGGAAPLPRARRGCNPYVLDNECEGQPRMKVAERNKGSLHVARIYYVRPTAGETYFLRLLLCHRAATSWEGLKTVDGTVHSTYRAACVALNLLTVETEFYDAMSAAIKDGVLEGSSYVAATPAQLRYLFLTMVLNGGDNVPVQQLYETFKYRMALDLSSAGQPMGVREHAQPLAGVNVYGKLAVPAADAEPEDDPELPMAHEYGLLQLLSNLIADNSTKTLEDVGLPTLESFQSVLLGDGSSALNTAFRAALHLDAAGATMLEQHTSAAPHVALLQMQFADRHPQLLSSPAFSAIKSAQREKLSLAAAQLLQYPPAEAAALYSSMYNSLNVEQKEIMDSLKGALDYEAANLAAERAGSPPPPPPSGLQRYTHVQARAGRGKTHLTLCAIAYARSLSLAVCVSSFTGVAASLLPGGITAHKQYGLPLDSSIMEPRPSTLSTNSLQGQFLRATSFHVIDEIESLHRVYFEEASRITTLCALQDDCSSAAAAAELPPFAGAVVLLTGDLHQTLPIVPGISNESSQLASLVRYSPIYRHFTTRQLTIPQRTCDDSVFDEWLGLLSVNTAAGPVPPEVPLTKPARHTYVPAGAAHFTNEQDARQWVFGPPGAFTPLDTHASILCAHNDTVRAHNHAILDGWLPGNITYCNATHDLAKDSEGTLHNRDATEEFMGSVEVPGAPMAALELKVGAIGLIMRNILPSEKIMNGTRVRVVALPRCAGGTSAHLLQIETIPLPGSGDAPRTFLLPRICFEVEAPGSITFLRRQFPIKLAYALTTNKSQGQTLNRVLLDTRKEVFAHGQAYVACSRVRNFACLAFLTEAAQAAGSTSSSGSRPTFQNWVLQRALHAGYIGQGASGQTAAASAPTQSPAPARPRLTRLPRNIPVRSKKHDWCKQPGALTLTAQRKQTAAALAEFVQGRAIGIMTQEDLYHAHMHTAAHPPRMILPQFSAPAGPTATVRARGRPRRDYQSAMLAQAAQPASARSLLPQRPTSSPRPPGPLRAHSSPAPQRKRGRPPADYQTAMLELATRTPAAASTRAAAVQRARAAPSEDYVAHMLHLAHAAFPSATPRSRTTTTTMRSPSARAPVQATGARDHEAMQALTHSAVLVPLLQRIAIHMGEDIHPTPKWARSWKTVDAAMRAGGYLPDSLIAAFALDFTARSTTPVFEQDQYVLPAEQERLFNGAGAGCQPHYNHLMLFVTEFMAHKQGGPAPRDGASSAAALHHADLCL